MILSPNFNDIVSWDTVYHLVSDAWILKSHKGRMDEVPGGRIHDDGDVDVIARNCTNTLAADVRVGLLRCGERESAIRSLGYR